MLVDDLALYGALGVGWLVGRRWPSSGPWVGRATLAAVLLLLGLLGASFRGLDGSELATALPLALAFVGLTFAATIAAYLVLARAARADRASPPGAVLAATPVRTTAFLAGALVAGYVVGRATAVPAAGLIPWALCALLALVGYGLELHWRTIGAAWLPLASAVLGAVGAAAMFSWVARLGAGPAFGTGLAFGWYSLAGPLLSARFGATIGLFAFLANFLREALVMTLAPYLGPRLRGRGLAALGGATAMDTTLYFIVRHGDSRAGAVALATGLTLTVAASLLVPAVLAL